MDIKALAQQLDVSEQTVTHMVESVAGRLADWTQGDLSLIDQPLIECAIADHMNDYRKMTTVALTREKEFASLIYGMLKS